MTVDASEARIDADRTLIRRSRSAVRARAVVTGLVLFAVGFVAFCLSVSLGEFPVPLLDVPAAMLGYGDPGAVFVVFELRLPRALCAVLVGGAFGLSGSIFQSLARNPLASPDIIGITAGASAIAVMLIVVGQLSGPILSVGALAGALVTAVAIYLLAWRHGVSSYRLVLVGIGCAAILGAVTSYLLTRAEIHDAQRAAVWLAGSLHGRGWEHVEPLAWALLVLVPATVALVPALRMLQLGDDTAQGLGLRVETFRALLLFVAVALAAVATAAAGPIAFVAFVAAPIARRLVRSPLTVIPAAMVGAVLLLVADLVAGRIFSPVELPVGIVTGIIGAPYLIWLLARTNRIGSGG